MDGKRPFFFIIVAVLLALPAITTGNIPEHLSFLNWAKLMRDAQKGDHRAQTRVALVFHGKQDFAEAA
jgi:hypothetical protein